MSASWLTLTFKRGVTRGLLPVLATIGLVTEGMISTTWGVHVLGRTAWALPDDLWGTLVAAQRLLHLQLSGLYTPPTGLIAFPGAAVILIPVVALMDAAGISLQQQTAQHPYPESWLLAGPFEIAISCLVLFAIDHLNERASVPLLNRFFVMVASAVALWSVSVRWGHPEDAVAMGLLLYGIGALPRARAGWLIGAAVAVQPLVLLALPVIAVATWARAGPRRLPGFGVRITIPSVVTLGAAAAANWHATITAVTKQPNFPVIDHPTPWTSLAPHLSDGNVAAGPGRVLAIVFACGCAAAYGYRLRTRLRARAGPGTEPDAEAAQPLTELLWWVAAALAMRCVFESVMVAYYVWPTLAVALTAAAGRWSRLIPVAVVTTAVTFASQAPWRDPWGWWLLIMAGLALTLYCARPPRLSLPAIATPTVEAPGAGARPGLLIPGGRARLLFIRRFWGGQLA